MSKIKECPNCRQPVDGDSLFCIFCGARFPDSTDEIPASPEPAPSGAVKKCANGHEFNDPKLDYCPACGLPLFPSGEPSTSSPAVDPDSWICSCGEANPAENPFCQACGKPREPGKRPERPDQPYPDGMYPPTDEDLKPKRQR